MFPFRLFAATGTALARLDSIDGASVQTTIVLRDEHQSREGNIVNGVMWLLFGHHKTRVPLTSNRYVCRRCGFDFGVEGPQAPAPAGPPATTDERKTGSSPSAPPLSANSSKHVA